MSSRNIRQASVLRRSKLAVALAMGLGLTGGAFAQSTTGTITGQAPAAAGETVQVTGSTGVTREVPVDASGRYRVGNLPLGTYTVNVMKGGAVVDSRKNVSLTVGTSSEVSFVEAANASSAQSLDQVTVTANSLPQIDVAAVDSRTVVTAETLARLPLGRNAEAIALLAPGAVVGSGDFGRTVSFGGAGVSENAYYINGYNTSDPLRNLGGVGLPYGAIDQQEVYTGGYSAMYGRSDGGVISQVGKRGTNEWHFGAQALWEPKFARSTAGNVMFPNKTLPAGYDYTDSSLPGTVYRNRDNNTQWTRTVSAYAGGPLIKDTLYMFIAAESEKVEGNNTTSAIASTVANNHYTYDLPKFYAKLDWNINDSNILELTGIKSSDERSGQYYGYDYATRQSSGSLGTYPDSTKTSSTYGIAKYTSYITDDLTLTATYGKSKTTDVQRNPGDNGIDPNIGRPDLQDPLITGGSSIANGTTTTQKIAPGANSKTHGLRVDLEWQIGDHRVTGGIDNMKYTAKDEGVTTTGPGYTWIYGRSRSPGSDLVPALGVGPAGGRGYYARRLIFQTSTSMSVDQKAYYLEDKWQINDKILLSVGVRNDKFTNYNNVGASYVDSGNQWAPRIGASWDVFGDSSLKIYGNLGRYYLALPNSVAIRGASSSTYTNEYFTYTGIAANGAPIGLTPLGPGAVSANGEYGQPNDAKSVAAADLKSQYQDEAILGFDKTLGPSWVTGAKLTFRKLQTAIDDVCDTGKIADKMVSQGLDPNSVTIPGCVIFNPGESNRFSLANANGNGRTSVTMSTSDWGFSEGAKRKYYALDMYLEHPFDGKWQGRVDYTFSKSYGNTEGQVKSDIGQNDISKTQDWDAAALMVHSNGLLANDRTHQLKAYGSYALTDEWMFSGALRITSGSPRSCLGYFGPTEADPIGYGSSYHSCAGKLYAPGDQRLPWIKQLDLSVTYRPSFADHKLAFGLSVFNVTNERKPTLVDSTYEDDRYTVSNTYGAGLYFQTPRYARLTATYDF
ncbi:TonB-dependent receptor-like protein [Luteibacter rhizovicinus]|uniref:TonB-dependent receptor-like protein n=1 Tax=Luteibacter rhizovicinus TaxID=242606 RepID=A0A4R3YJM2_9GAMM|nr:TonB-dependent receptor [Luteibacter rhizovicinus]TCV92436.1 TonB-dependent receptor-like protein [Luteibacter rhizovicinus]